MSLGVCVVGEKWFEGTIREITIEKKTRKQGFCERDNYAKTSEPKERSDRVVIDGRSNVRDGEPRDLS